MNTSLYRVPFLSALTVLFKPTGFIANKILTPVTVGNTDVDIPIWDRDSFYRVPDTKLGVNGDVNLIEIEATVTRKHLNDHALGSNTDQRQIAQGGGGLPVMMLRAQSQKIGLWLDEEYAIASALRDTAVVTLNETLVGGAQWSDDGSNPRADVLRWSASLLDRPNFGAMSLEVFNRLIQHPKIRDDFKYTVSGSITEEMLARYFGVEEIYVARGLVNTSTKGQAENLQRIWGKDFLLGYHTKDVPDPLLEQPTCGYLLRYGQAVGDNEFQAGKPDTEAYRVYVAPPNPRQGTGDGSIFSKTETNYVAAVTTDKLLFLGKSVLA